MGMCKWFFKDANNMVMAALLLDTFFGENAIFLESWVDLIQMWTQCLPSRDVYGVCSKFRHLSYFTVSQCHTCRWQLPLTTDFWETVFVAFTLTSTSVKSPQTISCRKYKSNRPAITKMILLIFMDSLAASCMPNVLGLVPSFMLNYKTWLNCCVLYAYVYQSPHQIGAFRWGLDVMTSGEISPPRHTQRCVMYFLVRLSIWNGKIKLSSEASRRECVMGCYPYTSRSESQHHKWENITLLWFCREIGFFIGLTQMPADQGGVEGCGGPIKSLSREKNHVIPIIIPYLLTLVNIFIIICLQLQHRPTCLRRNYLPCQVSHLTLLQPCVSSHSSPVNRWLFPLW